MCDFRNNNGESQDFSEWCHSHGIDYSKLKDYETPRVHLKIKEYNN